MSEATFNVIIGGVMSAVITLLVQIFQIVMQRMERKKQMAFRLWEKRAETYEKIFSILDMEHFMQMINENADELPSYFKNLVNKISSEIGVQAIFASREFNKCVSDIISTLRPVTDWGVTSPHSDEMDEVLKGYAKGISRLRDIARNEFKADKAVSYL